MTQDEKDKQDIAAGMHFLNIAGTLMDLAGKMERARAGGEQIDVFAAFREATSIMQHPDEAETVIDATEKEQ